MRVEGFVLFVVATVVTADVLTVQQKIEIVDYLSRDYFGSRVVTFLKLESEGNELIKAASAVGLVSSVMTLKIFRKIANVDFYPVPILVATLDEKHLSEFVKLTNDIEMSNMHWIVFSQMHTEKAENFYVPYNCKFMLITSSNGDIDFREIYRVAKKNQLQSNQLTTWNPSKRSDLPKTGFYARRLNFMGIKLKYLTHVLDPCIGSDNAFASGNVVPCIHEKVWLLTAEALNITTEPVLSPHREQSLIARAFEQQDIQISITGVFLSPVSDKGISFFWPIFKTELEVYVRYGGKGISWDRYLRPFTTNIWIAVIAWISGCSFVLFIAQKLASFYLKINKGCRREQFWTAIFAFLSQGSSEPAYSVWERLLLLSAFIGPAVLIPAYSASLTSFLAVQIPEMPFTELSEMKSHPQYRLTGTKTYNLTSFLEQGDDETSKYLINKGMLTKEKQPVNDSVGVVRMCKEPLAFISSSFFITALKPPCQYYVLPTKFVIFHQSMTMAKKTQYGVAFNIIMRKLRFSGVLQTLKYNVTRKQIFDLFLDKVQSRKLPPVDFESILVLLFFLIVAASTSFTVLFIEKILFSFNQKKKKQAHVSHLPVPYPFYM